MSHATKRMHWLRRRRKIVKRTERAQRAIAELTQGFARLGSAAEKAGETLLGFSMVYVDDLLTPDLEVAE
jgi:hypothetical protein